MFNVIVIAAVQLVAGYLLVPYTIMASTMAQSAAGLAKGPIAEMLLDGTALALAVFLIGLIVAILLGARYPGFGSLFFALLFVLGAAALGRYVPAAAEILKTSISRISATTKLPGFGWHHFATLLAFIGYWFGMIFRRRA